MRGVGPNDPAKNSLADVPSFTKVVPQCESCIHFQRGNPASCTAFPNGIPVQIWVNNHDHKQPFPGDHGIRYAKRTKQ